MRRPRSSLLKQIFGWPFFIFLAVALLAGWATWEYEGPDIVLTAVEGDFNVLLFLVPRMLGGMILAGLVQVILPPELVAKWVGEESGVGGVIIGGAVGALTPGGPMTSFPIVVAFYMSGADRGALVAYLTGWSLLGFQRMLVWELPLLGSEITLYRVAAVLVLPVVAGLIARQIPIAPCPVPGAEANRERDG